MERVRSLYRQQAVWGHVLEAWRDAYGDRWCDEDVQDAFVADVLDEPVVHAHPPLPKYSWNLCKQAIRGIESEGAAVADELIARFLAWQPKTETSLTAGRDLEVSCSSFEVGGTPCTVRVWPAFSQVGLALWPAGFVVAEWIMQHAGELKGANIVELGSGVGLSGIVAARCASPGRVVMTDYLETVNNNALASIALSGLAGKVEVELLDWTAVERGEQKVLDLIESFKTTCLLAADVVYDRTVIPALACTMRAFVSRSPALKRIVFAVTHRNEETFQLLREELRDNGLVLRESDMPKRRPDVFCYDASLIRIYSLDLQDDTAA
ncbi:hypothetical protein DIPPA_31407 [Diplonema papillatum]|nr:hypothetical protein DIPPA_31407 [Diplonema papillatum]